MTTHEAIAGIADPDEAALAFLYPGIETDAEGMLDVGDGHSVWWEASGAADGMPVIVLHGGPGGPTKPRMRRFYDPAFFRLYTMHQRGCGKSRPLGETRGNTTQALVADIEALRRHVGVDRWLVTGGSWGSALSLAYGEAHPDRCLGFMVSGVTLCRPEDTRWWWHGTRVLFPDAFDALVAALPDPAADPMTALHALLMDPDPAVNGPAARAISLYSAATVGLVPRASVIASYDDPEVALPLARFFVHYSVNRFFLEPGQLLRDLPRIAHLPVAIVGSRFDVTTPLDAAWVLHKAWPGSTLTISAGAHSLLDPAPARAFLDAIEGMKARIARPPSG